jgi:signal transduction histidine kinase/ActR/RegA family two-component response regulator
MATQSYPRLAITVASGITLALVLMGIVAKQRGSPDSFLPHGYCFTWNPGLLWAHVGSDALIGTAYTSIPLTLLYLVRKRTDLPFNWIVVLFATFIVSCGATHWIEVWTVWTPDYWLSAMVKMITATASVLTAVALVTLVPRILAIPTVDALNQAKAALEAEVRRRETVEAELRLERAELEERVLERTAELAVAIKEANSARAAALEANVGKDRFLAKVSHELRTPLQSTLTWVNVLKLPQLAPERIATATERIAHNVAAQARLIDDLLDISRILSGKLHLEWAMVDPVAVVRQAIAMVQDAQSDKIRVEADLRSESAVVWTDAARLEQVAWNLVNNAVQASEPGARVLVSLRADATSMALEVQDWGRGIAPDDLQTIFEPFLQGGGDRSRHRGLGLGLAIVNNILRVMGGEVTVRSDGPGRGATFSVRLPLESVADASEVPPAVERAQAAEVMRGLRVLYVEDEADIAEGTALLLGGLGVAVTVCTTFAQGTAALRSERFDLLLTDLMLDAGHTGIALMSILREHAPATPALVFSAFGRSSDIEDSLRAGFSAHLVKPLSLAALRDAIVKAAPVPAA